MLSLYYIVHLEREHEQEASYEREHEQKNIITT